MTAMRSRRYDWLAAALLLAAALGGTARAAAKVKVVVAIPPEAYFARRIGGDRVEVTVLVAPGQSPHTFEPTMRQMARLQSAQLYLSLELPFELKLLPRLQATNPGLTVVNVRKGVKLRRMHPGHGHQAEGAAREHRQGEGQADPHVWLNPLMVKTVAANMCEALARKDPSHADGFRRNLKTFRDELDALNAKVAEILAPVKGKEFLVFHPAFGYFADAYGLREVSIESEGKEPSARELAGIISMAKERGIRAVFVQKQFPEKMGEVIADVLGGVVVPLDPLAYDYPKNLEEMARTVARELADKH